MTLPTGSHPQPSPPDPQRSRKSQQRRDNMTAALDALSKQLAGGERIPIESFLGDDPALGSEAVDLGGEASTLVGDQPASEGEPAAATLDIGEALAAEGIEAPSGSELVDTSSLPSHADVVDAARGLLNGKIPRDQLDTISGANPGNRAGILLPPAATAWEAMLKAARADGVALFHGDTYRSWESQNSAYQKYRRGERGPGIIVAPPGTSKHGAGLAVDVTDGRGILSKGTQQWQWLSQNGARFGWYGISSEAWHWEYRGT